MRFMFVPPVDERCLCLLRSGPSQLQRRCHRRRDRGYPRFAPVFDIIQSSFRIFDGVREAEWLCG
jgi:hypothetical protein